VQESWFANLPRGFTLVDAPSKDIEGDIEYEGIEIKVASQKYIV
jgi:hypothetical protein